MTAADARQATTTTMTTDEYAPDNDHLHCSMQTIRTIPFLDNVSVAAFGAHLRTDWQWAHLTHTHTHNRKSFHINLCVIFLSHHFHIIISIYTFWPPFKMPYDRLKWVLCSVYKNGGHINVVAVVVHRMQTMAKCERFNISLKNHKTNYKLTLLLRWLVCFLNLVMCFAVSPCVCVCELWMWADNGPERECGNTRNVHHKRQR